MDANMTGTGKKIWVVFNPNGRAPTYTHQSYDSAKQEAKRLARMNPDQSFYVMESVGMARKHDVSFYACGTVDHRELSEDDIPF